MKDVKEIKQFELKVNDIKNLNIGEEIFIPESDYGLAEIHCVSGNFDEEKAFELYSIPMYGGVPLFECISSCPFEIFDNVTNWC
mgnify:CR=1 FL=1